MDIRGKNILMLGGSGLVGIAMARKLLPLHPARLVIAALRREEAEEGIATLRRSTDAEGVELVAEWGDILLRASRRNDSRTAMLETDVGRAEILDDLLGQLREEDF